MATLSVAICVHYSQSSSVSQLWAASGAGSILVGLSVWVAFSKHFEKLTFYKVAVTAIVVSVVGIYASPMLEDDHYRYLWDGYITATTGRPYRHPPSFYFGINTLPEHLQTLLSGINNPDIATVYGPLLQAIFAAAYVIAPGELWPLKVFLMASLLAILAMLAKSGVHPKWLLILCLHPLLVKESIVTAHPDLFIGALALGAVLLWRAEYLKWAAICISAAAAIKVSSAVLLLFFCFDKRGKFSWPTLLIGGVGFIVFNFPMIAEVLVGSTTGMTAFGGRWVFNPLFFRAIAASVGDASARAIVAALFGLALLLLTYWQRKHNSISQSIICTFAFLFLLSPAVNPWYWLWLLPIAMLERTSVLGLISIAALASLLAYIHVANAHLSTQLFTVPSWVAVPQALAILLILRAYLTSTPTLTPTNSALFTTLPKSNFH
jgi:alpha-1,6-mannosyltransferase